ncbi:hypothetical protein BLOT_002880 [Blomia tropicalis]|nr:hypothetical protein BLOT_002880 [Blomia tropicalis]
MKCDKRTHCVTLQYPLYQMSHRKCRENVDNHQCNNTIQYVYNTMNSNFPIKTIVLKAECAIA